MNMFQRSYLSVKGDITFQLNLLYDLNLTVNINL